MPVIYEIATIALRTWFNSRINSSAILESEQLFPGGKVLTSKWQDIRREALLIARNMQRIPRFHELMRAQKSISDNDGKDWRMFILKAYGVPIHKNLEQCPTLASILASTPEVLSASLSILGPGKRIPAHRGPFRGVLRGYLVLVMPRLADGRPASVLKIDGVEYRLHEGEFLLWDDTFEHAIWNESDQHRIVLLLDIKRPGMPLDLSLLSRLVIGAVRSWILLSRLRI